MDSDAGGLKDLLKGKLENAAGRLLHEAVGADVLPPALAAEPLYKSDLPWNAPKDSDTLVILCGDSRYFPHYLRFLSESLHLPSFYLVSVPGGVQWLALPDILPKHNKVARSAVEFLVSRHDVKRVVCIAHQSCGVYNDSQVMGALAHLATGKSVVDHQLEQLKKVGSLLNNSYGLAVELYYASVSDNQVLFHKVE